MKRAAVVAALLMGACGNASAQTESVPGTQPAAEIENFSHVDISNGILSARVFPPGKNELNRGARFDHAGVVFHVTYKGQDFSSYWFDRFVTDPLDNGKYPPATEHSCCNMSGPVEEFSAVGFDEAGIGGRFLKPGIGIFQRTNDKYDQFSTSPVLNEGARTFKSTRTGARFTQDLKDPESGYGYRYAKSVQLVPGKPQMTISHVLTNTGSKPIVTQVFCHNFLTIDPGSENLVITAPFAVERRRTVPARTGQAGRQHHPLPGADPQRRHHPKPVDRLRRQGQRLRLHHHRHQDRLRPAHPRRHAASPRSTCGRSPRPTAWNPMSPYRSSPARPSAGPTPTTSSDLNRTKRRTQ